MFGASAAASLRKGLAQAGRKEKVVCLFDDFSFGPINPPDPLARIHWADIQLGCSDWAAVVAATQPFLAASLSGDVHPVAWYSRRDAREYSNFLWWLSQLNYGQCDAIDLTDLKITRPGYEGQGAESTSVVSASLLLPKELIDLIDTSCLLPSDRRCRYVNDWIRLTNEDAPLRVLDKMNLVSAPITFFDELLLSCADHSFRKMARVVGTALAKVWESDLHQAGDIVLAARVRALVEAGALESRGDLAEMRFCEVRLAERAS